jgi:hypothetical protein
MSEPVVRASDAERERAVELLRRHSVDGRLTLEEFAARISLAYDAKTRQDLDELTRDLPEEPPASAPVQRREPSRWIVSLLGGTNRRGRFRLGSRTNVVAVAGGVNIDLRQAEIAAQEVTITIVCVMGGANIVVPEGVDVELTGLSFLGGKGYTPGEQPVPPGAPLIHVRGFAFMGGVGVATRRTST